MLNPQKAFVQNQISGLVVSNMVNVDSWKFFYFVQNAESKTKQFLGQIKKGRDYAMHCLHNQNRLEDENGRVTKVTKQVQDVIDSLEKTVKK
jgi:hypothetical protein